MYFVNIYVAFYNAAYYLPCMFVFFIIKLQCSVNNTLLNLLFFFVRLTMPLKGAKTRNYNKKYYFENKNIIIRVVKNLLHMVRQVTANTQTVAPNRLPD